MDIFQTIQRKFVLAILLCLTMLVMPSTAFAQQLTENECWSMDYCEIAVDYFDRIVKKYGNKMEIIRHLDEACLKIPSEFACICKTIRDSHGIQVIEKLLERMQPREICMRIEHGML